MDTLDNDVLFSDLLEYICHSETISLTLTQCLLDLSDCAIPMDCLWFIRIFEAILLKNQLKDVYILNRILTCLISLIMKRVPKLPLDSTTLNALVLPKDDVLDQVCNF